MPRKQAPSRAPAADDRVVALVGPELFLRTEHTALLRAALEKAHGQVDVVRFDGASASPAEVLDECRSFGLLAGHKLVVVDDADRLLLADNRPLFERYCQAPCEGATLVLRAEKWNAGKIDALIEQAGVFVQCDPIADEARAAAWACKRCERAHGRSIDPDAARLLISRLGTDLARVDTELAKLASGTPEGEAIARARVLDLVGATREEEVWALQGELVSGDPRRALAHARRVLENSPRDQETLLVFAVADLARKLVLARAGLEGGVAPRALIAPLKLWGPSMDAVLSAARRVDPGAARRLLHEAVDADAGLKSGLGRADRVIDRLGVRFAGICAPSGR